MNEITVPLKLDSECVPLKLNWIPPGRFIMGDKEALSLDEIEVKPMGEFEVILSKGYWLGIYPVTQCQWQAVMGNNPSFSKDSNLPAELISWQEAMDFCNRLSVSQLGVPKGYIFSLPTEAQWEYACRAGTTYQYQLGDSLDDLSRVAWHLANNSDFSIQPVGQKEPNNWGLYDMLGNVMEWCFDSPIDYPNGTTQIDWIGGLDDIDHNLRGGSALTPLSSESNLLTCSGRAYAAGTSRCFGFRLCLRECIGQLGQK